MCPACELLSTLPKLFEPHTRMVKHGVSTGHVDGLGSVSVAYFLCTRCSHVLQRDGYGGRRRGWRVAGIGAPGGRPGQAGQGQARRVDEWA